jgi:hypothetical protein
MFMFEGVGERRYGFSMDSLWIISLCESHIL